ncbi:hypothetical protein MHYP_G00001180 [Metynnis hypsauchen]
MLIGPRNVETSMRNRSRALPVGFLVDAFVDLNGRQKESVFSSSWPSIVSVFSLAALGAVGFTIGAYLAQK